MEREVRELNWLVDRLHKAVRIRDQIKTTQASDPGTLNHQISEFADVPWRNFFVEQDATESLLHQLCPGWIYIGEEQVGPYRSAKVGNTRHGSIRGTNRVSDPSTVSLLTLVFETHIYLIGDWIEGFLTGDLDVKKLIDSEFTSPYKDGALDENVPNGA